MTEKQNRARGLTYSASLAGAAVLLYILLRKIFSTLLSALPGNSAAGLLIGCAAVAAMLLPPALLLDRWFAARKIPGPALRAPTAAVVFEIPLILLLTTVCSALTGLVRQVTDLGGYTPPETTRLPESGVLLFLAFLSICVLPAFFEEFLFRGMIQRLFDPWGRWFSIFVTSLLFSLLHADLTQLPSIFLLSVFLGYASSSGDNLTDAFILHFANNLSGFVILLVQQSQSDMNAAAFVVILYTIYIGAGLLTAVLAWHRQGLKPLPAAERDAGPRRSRTLQLFRSPVFAFTVFLLCLIAVLEFLR